MHFLVIFIVHQFSLIYIQMQQLMHCNKAFNEIIKCGWYLSHFCIRFFRSFSIIYVFICYRHLFIFIFINFILLPTDHSFQDLMWSSNQIDLTYFHPQILPNVYSLFIFVYQYMYIKFIFGSTASDTSCFRSDCLSGTKRRKFETETS